VPTPPAPLQLLLGDPDADHLVLRPLRRSHPEAEDFWEANWLKVDVSARAGAFRGTVEADLRSDELERFAEQLAALQPDGKSRAALESMEGWVTARLSLDQRGRLEAACEVRDDPAAGSCLRFTVRAEQAQLPALLASLAALLRAYPVVGSPDAEGGDLLAGAAELDEG